MTQPVPHGYPDYGRQASESDILIYEFEDFAFTGNILSDPLFIGNAPYLFVRVTSVANVRVSITWYTTPLANTTLGFDHVSTGDIGEASVNFAVRGTYIEIFTQIDPADEPEFVTVAVYAVRHPYNWLVDVDSPTHLIDAMNVNIAAGANQIFNAVVVRSGRVRWTADFQGATTFIVYVESVDFDGVVRRLDFVRAQARATSRELYIPPIPVRIRAFNQDAVLRELTASMVIDPFVH